MTWKRPFLEDDTISANNSPSSAYRICTGNNIMRIIMILEPTAKKK
jgi:hypothetical protein